jgi:two-component system, OmpR family, sensor kinase ParS
MGKLFLKLWVLILLTSLTSFLIQRQVFNWTTEEANANYVLERQKRTFIFVEEILRPHPKEEWPVRFDALMRRIGVNARLVNLDDLAASGELEAGTVEKIRAHEIHTRPLADSSGAIMYRTIHDSAIVAALEVTAPPQARVLGVIKPLIFTWAVECSLFALAVLLWLRLFWRDLKRLSGAAENIGIGNFDVDVKLRGGSALKPLADSFRLMQTRIKTLVTSHKDLTNAVSHELKTPLARLRFAISLLAESKSDSERNQLLEKMQHDVDELNQLVQEMLLYSRLERDVPRIQLESTPVSTWLNTAIADETDAAAAEGISLPVNIEGSATAVPCEPRYMARAVRNLVRNALRHAHSSIRVSIAYHDTNCTIHVDDDGAGIPTEQRERLFIPFTRIDESRSRLTESASSSSGGSGLGLAIVKRIAEWHGGNATITDSPLGGARVSIQWPSALGTAS